MMHRLMRSVHQPPHANHRVQSCQGFPGAGVTSARGRTASLVAIPIAGLVAVSRGKLVGSVDRPSGPAPMRVTFAQCDAPNLTSTSASGEDARIYASSSHSAPGQAAGYEYQRQLSLVLLAEALREDPKVAVRLEAIEDIDVISEIDSVSRSVQAKHHLDDYTLTDRSPELWRTLRVWMDLEDALGNATLPNLQLMTTSTAAPGTAVALLGPESRDVTAALSKLLSVAEEHGAEESRVIRRRFAELPESSQLKILHAATILDASEPVAELDARLRDALGMIVPREQPDAFLQRVKGWWVNRSVELLTRERDQITAEQLYEFCDAVRDDYRRGSLAITSELRKDPDAEAKQPLLSKPFVQQLHLVGAPDEIKDLAVRHYYRAYAQRGQWAREIDDLDEDIQGYEQTLKTSGRLSSSP